MQLPTLYKRTKTGAIQQWQIFMEYGDGIGADEYPYYVLSGQLGGKLTQHVKLGIPKNIGKTNETTPEQQAELEMQSEWKSKHDEGYKSLEDLGIIEVNSTTFHLRLSDSDAPAIFEELSLKDVLEIVLQEFNTDASGRVKPMLATDLGKIKKIEYPVFIDRKYNGVRSLTTVYPGGTSLITSRSGKEYKTLSHVQDLLSKWAQAVCLLQPITFDGEIYSHGLTLQAIASATKKLNDDSPKLQIRVYDIVNDHEQWDRDLEMRVQIQSLQAVTGDFETITAVSRGVVNNWEEVKALHDEYVEDGYEGAILRLRYGKYSPGQRSRELIKVKEFDSTEFELLYLYQGEREEDVMARGRRWLDKEKSTHVDFGAKIVGNRATKAELVEQFGWKKPIWDKVITVKHFGYTPDGIPFHPVGEAMRDYE